MHSEEVASSFLLAMTWWVMSHAEVEPILSLSKGSMGVAADRSGPAFHSYACKRYAQGRYPFQSVTQLSEPLIYVIK
ncbi:MAG: hypothetical protein ACHQHN_17365 [Sphingobacteriales bacterium]